MDLNQRKLNRSEWNSIEISVSNYEIDILNLIIKGYHDVNIKINNNNSLFGFLKIEYTEKMEDYLYNKYFRVYVDKIEEKILKKIDNYKKIKISSDIKINSSDKIRLDRYDENSIKKTDIYEFILLSHAYKMISNSEKKIFTYHYFTLYNLIKNNIIKLNRHIKKLINELLELLSDKVEMIDIIENAVEFIEKNENLLKFNDMTLYEHQKEIFTSCKVDKPKLILYMAPTGTGKTLSPIALSEQKKIIFVCAARHVGLALARSAISVKKKVAFAFGCSSADDIRLHYFAAKEFTRNKRSGGVGKVDNSVGDNVEIMICDIKSYLPAMYYMLAFFKAEDIIFYWDEPTITLDYQDHEFHKTIRQNWKHNLIPNVVLSSATLPKLNELTETIPDFMNKFKNAEIFNIVSHDCKKSIPIINKDGYVVLPHHLHDNYKEIIKITEHCNNYLTLLRYFDLKEIVEFISYVIRNNYITKKLTLERNFDSIDDINMKNIKIYYLKLLQNISENDWKYIFIHFKRIRQPRIFENETIDIKGNKIQRTKSLSNDNNLKRNPLFEGMPLSKIASEQIIHNNLDNLNQSKLGTSGVYVTTKDAYTLTDGPTIFISNDIEKIAKFCVQQANIPSIVMDDIMKKIEYNNVINEKLSVVESELEYIKEKSNNCNSSTSELHKGLKVATRNKSSKDSKKINRDLDNGELENKGEISKITNEINNLRSMIKSASLNDTFVPNKKLHLNKWAEGLNINNSFTSNIDEHTVSDIMALNGVDNLWKILLMMGIGVFINHENITYTEIMKKLADEQKLYMIIASSDYIYGTNYQFCHGFLSKDLDLTQEKIIQAMGRIGRNNIQQTYTVRFRDDNQIMKLFTSDTEKPEIINMNILFNTNKVKFCENKYIELEDTENNYDDEQYIQKLNKNSYSDTDSERE
jgi:hypothetical protein